MAGAFDNRHRNFLAVLQSHGTMASASAQIGVSANYLSQLKGGKRIGHVMARRIEHGLNLQPGWLDLDHSKNPSSNLSEHELIAQALALPVDARTRLLKKLANSLP